MTSGRPFLPIDVRIVTLKNIEGDKLKNVWESVVDDGKQVGEVQVRGQTLFTSYWNNPQATEESFTTDGWFQTGDLAVQHKNAYMTVVDRRNDMIVVGGENVYTTEVENVLHSHPRVVEAAVFGISDDLLGQVVHAVVKVVDQKKDETDTLTENKDTDSNAIENLLIHYLSQRLAPFKIPVRIQLVSEIPKTGSGKIKRNIMRKRFNDANDATTNRISDESETATTDTAAATTAIAATTATTAALLRRATVHRSEQCRVTLDGCQS